MAKTRKPDESRVLSVIWLALQVILCFQLVATALYYNGLYTNPLIHKFLIGQYLALSAWLVFGVHGVLRGRFEWPRSGFLWPGLILVAWALVRSLFTEKSDAVLNAYIFASFASVYPLWVLTLRERRFRTLVCGTVVFSAFVMMLGCIRQLLTDDPAFELPFLDMMTLARGSYERQELGSFMGHNIQSGAVIAVGALCATYFLTVCNRLWQHLVVWAYIVLGVVLVFLGGSRGVVLMMLPAVVYLAIAYRHLWLHRVQAGERLPMKAIGRTAIGLGMVLLVAGAGVGGWMMVSPKAAWENSVVARFVSPPEELFSGTYPRVWWMSILMITHNPVAGVGMSAWPYQYPFYQETWFGENPDTWIGLPKIGFHTMRAHNDYLHIWAELGLPGLFCVVWMLVLFARVVWKRLQSPHRYTHEHAACAVAIAILTHATVFFTFHVATTGSLFVAMLALAAGPHRSRPVSWTLPKGLRFHTGAKAGVIAVAVLLYALALMPNHRYGVSDYMARLFVRYADRAVELHQAGDVAEYTNMMHYSYYSMQRATEIEPRIGIQWYDLGKEAIYRGIGTGMPEVVRNGIEYLQKSRAGYSFYVTFAELGKAHAWLWQQAGRAEDFDAAVQHYERAVRIMPTFYEGWANLALLHARNGDAGRSIELISELELRFPGFVEETIVNQALLAENRGATVDAMFFMSMASASQPANFAIFRHAIEFYQRVDRLDLGADIFVNTVHHQDQPGQEGELMRLLSDILYTALSTRRYELAYQTVTGVEAHPVLSENGQFWLLRSIASWSNGFPYEALAALHRGMEHGLPGDQVAGFGDPMVNQFLLSAPER